ncbi:DNA/RNA helicase domain-containing protein [Amycolatopsis kentuckyensis]|uniref:DNA/RNA helicase domain-containing protein n=1 Tax=Amycolatopsis kentuckyensis TaxID=218823 RepID=UPI00356481F4
MRYLPGEDRGQLGAWRNSLPALFDLLCTVGLGHVQVLLEHRLPYSPRRVDAMLCGVHPETGRPSYVLVELKQWSKPTMVARGLVRGFAQSGQPDLHPAEQVRRYCRYLLDFTPQLARNPAQVKGLAYLHNAERSAGWNLDDFHFDDFGQLYTRDQMGDLVADLTGLLADDPHSADAARSAAQALVEAPRTPARTLLKAAADAIAGRGSFLLLDEQKVAYDRVLSAVERADRPAGRDDWRKTVVIVRGGPGSGKSAIAIALLSALAGRREKVLHATGSRAFTETLWREVAGGDERIMDLFKYFNNFDHSAENSLDVLICDEAHRIRDNNNVPARWQHKIPPQVAQLIDVAKVPVFLLDEHQAVRPGEAHTVRRIAEVAEAKGCLVEKITLDGQFRCGGSSYYDDWVLRLLGVASGGPVVWSEFVAGTDDEYVVDSVNSPDGLEAWLNRQVDNFSGTARIAAGYCWEWKNPLRENGGYTPVRDVRIGGWSRPWNIRQGHEAEGFPSASYWASDPDGFGQVGCIYTAQGFEYDWSGVIFGEDLVIRNGQWRPQPGKSYDGSVNRTDPQTFGRLVRNTYKVLMTRGMSGTCLYSVDEETNEFLHEYCR